MLPYLRMHAAPGLTCMGAGDWVQGAEVLLWLVETMGLILLIIEFTQKLRDVRATIFPFQFAQQVGGRTACTLACQCPGAKGRAARQRLQTIFEKHGMTAVCGRCCCAAQRGLPANHLAAGERGAGLPVLAGAGHRRCRVCVAQHRCAAAGQALVRALLHAACPCKARWLQCCLAGDTVTITIAGEYLHACNGQGSWLRKLKD